MKLPEPLHPASAMGNGYTESQMHQARVDALEEAAKVCDDWRPNCADAIRALKEKQV